MTLDPKPDTRGSRKALGAENARLKSKVGRLCIENNELRDQLALMTKAFELATANGLTYQVEGWGGSHENPNRVCGRVSRKRAVPGQGRINPQPGGGP